MQVKNQQLELDMKQRTCSKLRKGYVKAVYCHAAYSASMQITPPLRQKSEEELKRLLMKLKEKSEKFGLKLNIQKIKIMASSPITSCQIDGETVETVANFIVGDSKITADGDCCHEIKDAYSLEEKL